MHRLPIDRCYLVEVRRESNASDDATALPRGVSQTQLWTWGDQFWIQSATGRQRWAWGRDDAGPVWLADGARRGLRLDAAEVPPWLALTCDINSMKLETLLDDVLRDFDLRREGHGPDTLPTTILIRAELKSGRKHSTLRSALLELDAETKVLRRVVLSRSRLGRPVATTTYSLVDSQVQDQLSYTLAGHLQEPSETFTRDHDPARRQEILIRLLGPQAERWFKSQAAIKTQE